MKYPLFRNLHLLLALFAIPFLLMYGVSAVQMAHHSWFDIRPRVSETRLTLAPGLDPRALARALMERGMRGELAEVRPGPSGCTLRLALPGTVRQVRYERTTGEAVIKTSEAGTLGLLNRLHHGAGFWHEPLPLELWGAFVALVSLALLGMGATGLYMWFARRKDRRLGLILLALNLTFSLVVVTLLRWPGR